MQIDQVKQKVPTQIPANNVWPAVLHKQHARMTHLIISNESGERKLAPIFSTKIPPVLDVFVSLCDQVGLGNKMVSVFIDGTPS